MAFGDAIKKQMGGRWIKVNAEQSAKVIVVGDERVDICRWTGSAIETCDKDHADASMRFAVNVYVVDEDRFAVLEGSRGMAKAIDRALGRHKEPQVIVIGPRTGAGKTTAYPVLVNGPAGPDALKRIAEVTYGPDGLYNLDLLWEGTVRELPPLTAEEQKKADDDVMPF